MPKAYMGRRCRDGRAWVIVVEENGILHPLDPRFDLRNHSPDGFNWGYGGSGPAQLALALLADALEDDDLARALYQDYKARVVAALPDGGWRLDLFDVFSVCELIALERATRELH